MALATSLLLTLMYAFGAPLGRRVRAAEHSAVQLIRSALEPPPSEPELRRILMRGWFSFTVSDLWLLLLLAALVMLFVDWRVALALPAGGVVGRWAVDRAGLYPRGSGWYWKRFRHAAKRAEPEADPGTRRLIDDVIRSLDRLVARRGDQPVLEPVGSEAGDRAGD